MTYDEFKAAWVGALRESGLPLLSAHDGVETLDVRSLSLAFHARGLCNRRIQRPPMFDHARRSCSSGTV